MATLESEMDAAVAGGITSLACPPDTDPPLDEPDSSKMLKFRAKNLNQSRVYPVGASLSASRHASDRNGGAHGRWLRRGLAMPTHRSPTRNCCCARLQYAATFDFPVWLRPQNADWRAAGLRTTARCDRLGLAAIPCAPRLLRCRPYCACTRDRRTRSSVPAVEQRRGRHGCAGPNEMA